MTTSSRTTRPDVVVRSKEREFTEEAFRPSCNIFDRLGRSKGEDMRTHLEVKCTSRPPEGEKIFFSPINDEINKLRARLKKLAANG